MATIDMSRVRADEGIADLRHRLSLYFDTEDFQGIVDDDANVCALYNFVHDPHQEMLFITHDGKRYRVHLQLPPRDECGSQMVYVVRTPQYKPGAYFGSHLSVGRVSSDILASLRSLLAEVVLPIVHDSQFDPTGQRVSDLSSFELSLYNLIATTEAIQASEKGAGVLPMPPEDLLMSGETGFVQDVIHLYVDIWTRIIRDALKLERKIEKPSDEVSWWKMRAKWLSSLHQSVRSQKAQQVLRKMSDPSRFPYRIPPKTRDSDGRDIAKDQLTEHRDVARVNSRNLQFAEPYFTELETCTHDEFHKLVHIFRYIFEAIDMIMRNCSFYANDRHLSVLLTAISREVIAKARVYIDHDRILGISNFFSETGEFQMQGLKNLFRFGVTYASRTKTSITVCSALKKLFFKYRSRNHSETERHNVWATIQSVKPFHEVEVFIDRCLDLNELFSIIVDISIIRQAKFPSMLSHCIGDVDLREVNDAIESIFRQFLRHVRNFLFEAMRPAWDRSRKEDHEVVIDSVVPGGQVVQSLGHSEPTIITVPSAEFTELFYGLRHEIKILERQLAHLIDSALMDCFSLNGQLSYLYLVRPVIDNPMLKSVGRVILKHLILGFSRCGKRLKHLIALFYRHVEGNLDVAADLIDLPMLPEITLPGDELFEDVSSVEPGSIVDAIEAVYGLYQQAELFYAPLSSLELELLVDHSREEKDEVETLNPELVAEHTKIFTECATDMSNKQWSCLDANAVRLYHQEMLNFAESVSNLFSGALVRLVEDFVLYFQSQTSSLGKFLNSHVLVINPDTKLVSIHVEEKHADLLKMAVRFLRFMKVAEVEREGSDVIEDLQSRLPERLKRIGRVAKKFHVIYSSLFVSISTYNHVLTALTPPMRNLIKGDLEAAVRSLEEGATHITWKIHGAQAYCKMLENSIIQLKSRAEKLLQIVEAIRTLSSAWGEDHDIILVDSGLTCEELLHQNELNGIHVSEMISNHISKVMRLLLQAHRSLNIPQDDPQWRQFDESVREMITSAALFLGRHELSKLIEKLSAHEKTDDESTPDFFIKGFTYLHGDRIVTSPSYHANMELDILEDKHESFTEIGQSVSFTEGSIMKGFQMDALIRLSHQRMVLKESELRSSISLDELFQKLLGQLVQCLAMLDMPRLTESTDATNIALGLSTPRLMEKGEGSKQASSQIRQQTVENNAILAALATDDEIQQLIRQIAGRIRDVNVFLSNFTQKTFEEFEVVIGASSLNSVISLEELQEFTVSDDTELLSDDGSFVHPTLVAESADRYNQLLQVRISHAESIFGQVEEFSAKGTIRHQFLSFIIAPFRDALVTRVSKLDHNLKRFISGNTDSLIVCANRFYDGLLSVAAEQHDVLSAFTSDAIAQKRGSSDSFEFSTVQRPIEVIHWARRRYELIHPVLRLSDSLAQMLSQTTLFRNSRDWLESLRLRTEALHKLSKKVLAKIDSATPLLDRYMSIFKGAISQFLSRLNARVDSFRTTIKSSGSFVDHEVEFTAEDCEYVSQVTNTLAAYKETLDDLDENSRRINLFYETIRSSNRADLDITETKKHLEEGHQLWTNFVSMYHALESFTKSTFGEFDMDSFEAKIQQFLDLVNSLSPVFTSSTSAFLPEVMDLSKLIPTLKSLKQKSLTTYHWKHISNLFDQELTSKLEFPMNVLWPRFRHDKLLASQVSSIAFEANREAASLLELEQLEQAWFFTKFSLQSFPIVVTEDSLLDFLSMAQPESYPVKREANGNFIGVFDMVHLSSVSLFTAHPFESSPLSYPWLLEVTNLDGILTAGHQLPILQRIKESFTILSTCASRNTPRLDARLRDWVERLRFLEKFLLDLYYVSFCLDGTYCAIATSPSSDFEVLKPALLKAAIGPAWFSFLDSLASQVSVLFACTDEAVATVQLLKQKIGGLVHVFSNMLGSSFASQSHRGSFVPNSRVNLFSILTQRLIFEDDLNHQAGDPLFQALNFIIHHAFPSVSTVSVSHSSIVAVTMVDGLESIPLSQPVDIREISSMIDLLNFLEDRMTLTFASLMKSASDFIDSCVSMSGPEMLKGWLSMPRFVMRLTVKAVCRKHLSEMDFHDCYNKFHKIYQRLRHYCVVELPEFGHQRDLSNLLLWFFLKIGIISATSVAEEANAMPQEELPEFQAVGTLMEGNLYDTEIAEEMAIGEEDEEVDDEDFEVAMDVMEPTAEMKTSVTLETGKSTSKLDKDKKRNLMSQMLAINKNRSSLRKIETLPYGPITDVPSGVQELPPDCPIMEEILDYDFDNFTVSEGDAVLEMSQTLLGAPQLWFSVNPPHINSKYHAIMCNGAIYCVTSGEHRFARNLFEMPAARDCLELFRFDGVEITRMYSAEDGWHMETLAADMNSFCSHAKGVIIGEHFDILPVDVYQLIVNVIKDNPNLAGVFPQARQDASLDLNTVGYHTGHTQKSYLLFPHIFAILAYQRIPFTYQISMQFAEVLQMVDAKIRDYGVPFLFTPSVIQRIVCGALNLFKRVMKSIQDDTPSTLHRNMCKSLAFIAHIVIEELAPPHIFHHMSRGIKRDLLLLFPDFAVTYLQELAPDYLAFRSYRFGENYDLYTDSRVPLEATNRYLAPLAQLFHSLAGGQSRFLVTANSLGCPKQMFDTICGVLDSYFLTSASTSISAFIQHQFFAVDSFDGIAAFTNVALISLMELIHKYLHFVKGIPTDELPEFILILFFAGPLSSGTDGLIFIIDSMARQLFQSLFPEAPAIAIYSFVAHSLGAFYDYNVQENVMVGSRVASMYRITSRKDDAVVEIPSSFDTTISQSYFPINLDELWDPEGADPDAMSLSYLLHKSDLRYEVFSLDLSLGDHPALPFLCNDLSTYTLMHLDLYQPHSEIWAPSSSRIDLMICLFEGIQSKPEHRLQTLVWAYYMAIMIGVAKESTETVDRHVKSTLRQLLAPSKRRRSQTSLGFGTSRTATSRSASSFTRLTSRASLSSFTQSKGGSSIGGSTMRSDFSGTSDARSAKSSGRSQRSKRGSQRGSSRQSHATRVKGIIISRLDRFTPSLNADATEALERSSKSVQRFCFNSTLHAIDPDTCRTRYMFLEFNPAFTSHPLKRVLEHRGFDVEVFIFYLTPFVTSLDLINEISYAIPHWEPTLISPINEQQRFIIHFHDIQAATESTLAFIESLSSTQVMNNPITRQQTKIEHSFFSVSGYFNDPQFAGASVAFSRTVSSLAGFLPIPMDKFRDSDIVELEAKILADAYDVSDQLSNEYKLISGVVSCIHYILRQLQKNLKQFFGSELFVFSSNHVPMILEHMASQTPLMANFGPSLVCWMVWNVMSFWVMRCSSESESTYAHSIIDRAVKHYFPPEVSVHIPPCNSFIYIHKKQVQMLCQDSTSGSNLFDHTLSVGKFQHVGDLSLLRFRLFRVLVNRMEGDYPMLPIAIIFPLFSIVYTLFLPREGALLCYPSATDNLFMFKAVMALASAVFGPNFSLVNIDDTYITNATQIWESLIRTTVLEDKPLILTLSTDFMSANMDREPLLRNLFSKCFDVHHPLSHLHRLFWCDTILTSDFKLEVNRYLASHGGTSLLQERVSKNLNIFYNSNPIMLFADNMFNYLSPLVCRLPTVRYHMWSAEDFISAGKDLLLVMTINFTKRIQKSSDLGTLTGRISASDVAKIVGKRSILTTNERDLMCFHLAHVFRIFTEFCSQSIVPAPRKPLSHSKDWDLKLVPGYLDANEANVLFRSFISQFFEIVVKMKLVSAKKNSVFTAANAYFEWMQRLIGSGSAGAAVISQRLSELEQESGDILDLIVKEKMREEEFVSARDANLEKVQSQQGVLDQLMQTLSEVEAEYEQAKLSFVALPPCFKEGNLNDSSATTPLTTAYRHLMLLSVAPDYTKIIAWMVLVLLKLVNHDEDENICFSRLREELSHMDQFVELFETFDPESLSKDVHQTLSFRLQSLELPDSPNLVMTGLLEWVQGAMSLHDKFSPLVVSKKKCRDAEKELEVHQARVVHSEEWIDASVHRIAKLQERFLDVAQRKAGHRRELDESQSDVQVLIRLSQSLQPVAAQFQGAAAQQISSGNATPAMTPALRTPVENANPLGTPALKELHQGRIKPSSSLASSVLSNAALAASGTTLRYMLPSALRGKFILECAKDLIQREVLHLDLCGNLQQDIQAAESKLEETHIELLQSSKDEIPVSPLAPFDVDFFLDFFGKAAETFGSDFISGSPGSIEPIADEENFSDFAEGSIPSEADLDDFDPCAPIDEVHFDSPRTPEVPEEFDRHDTAGKFRTLLSRKTGSNAVIPKAFTPEELAKIPISDYSIAVKLLEGIEGEAMNVPTYAITESSETILNCFQIDKQRVTVVYDPMALIDDIVEALYTDFQRLSFVSASLDQFIDAVNHGGVLLLTDFNPRHHMPDFWNPLITALMTNQPAFVIDGRRIQTPSNLKLILVSQQAPTAPSSLNSIVRMLPWMDLSLSPDLISEILMYRATMFTDPKLLPQLILLQRIVVYCSNQIQALNQELAHTVISLPQSVSELRLCDPNGKISSLIEEVNLNKSRIGAAMSVVTFVRRILAVTLLPVCSAVSAVIHSALSFGNVNGTPYNVPNKALIFRRCLSQAQGSLSTYDVSTIPDWVASSISIMTSVIQTRLNHWPHRLVLGLLICCNLDYIPPNELDMFLEILETKPDIAILGEQLPFPFNQDFYQSLVSSSADWIHWTSAIDPIEAPLPFGFDEHLTDFHKLLLISVLAPNRITFAIEGYLKSVNMGQLVLHVPPEEILRVQSFQGYKGLITSQKVTYMIPEDAVEITEWNHDPSLFDQSDSFIVSNLKSQQSLALSILSVLPADKRLYLLLESDALPDICPSLITQCMLQGHIDLYSGIVAPQVSDRVELMMRITSFNMAEISHRASALEGVEGAMVFIWAILCGVIDSLFRCGMIPVFSNDYLRTGCIYLLNFPSQRGIHGLELLKTVASFLFESVLPTTHLDYHFIHYYVPALHSYMFSEFDDLDAITPENLPTYWNKYKNIIKRGMDALGFFNSTDPEMVEMICSDIRKLPLYLGTGDSDSKNGLQIKERLNQVVESINSATGEPIRVPSESALQVDCTSLSFSIDCHARLMQGLRRIMLEDAQEVTNAIDSETSGVSHRIKSLSFILMNDFVPIRWMSLLRISSYHMGIPVHTEYPVAYAKSLNLTTFIEIVTKQFDTTRRLLSLLESPSVRIPQLISGTTLFARAFPYFKPFLSTVIAMTHATVEFSDPVLVLSTWPLAPVLMTERDHVVMSPSIAIFEDLPVYGAEIDIEYHQAAAEIMDEDEDALRPHEVIMQASLQHTSHLPHVTFRLCSKQFCEEIGLPRAYHRLKGTEVPSLIGDHLYLAGFAIDDAVSDPLEVEVPYAIFGDIYNDAF